MTGPRIGSLFAGYGGLEMGVASVLGGEPAWFSEIDPAPSRILAHHWPHVPNLGDITTVDWDTVEPIDVLTGGFPCQDVSHAGKRLGLKPGTRSGLWSHMAYAIDKLRPRLVVAENVRGLLSAEAGGDLEPCPWCVGDGERGALRALGAVLGDLADLRYDAQWVGVRASDAGAPHGRFRVFVFAWPAADADVPRLERRRVRGSSRGERATRSGGVEPAADTSGQRHGRGVHPGHMGPVDGHHASQARERERAREVPRDRSAAPVRWGKYEPAIRRWERVLGRVAPPPTEPGKNGQARLSPVFVEFLMGLPAGHVTAVPGLTRNDQLKALGNGVVPQQAALATHIWAATMQGTYPTATTTGTGSLLPTPRANDRAGNALDGGRTDRDKLRAMGWMGSGIPDTGEATGTDDGGLW